MSVRGNIRSTLVAVDRRLGVRDWLRQGEENPDLIEKARCDPFTVSPELQHERPKTVLDIGGSHGQFAQEIFRTFAEAVIYSFEPIPECFEELKALSELHPTLRPIQLALSDREGEAKFQISKFRDSSSLQEMLPAHTEAWPNTETETTTTVRISRLDEVAPQLKLEPPVFAKLDVQGHELAVIHGGRETLSRCQRVMTECNFASLYKGQPSFIDLYDEMKKMGFLFDGLIAPLRHPRTKELLSADLIFYKPGKNPT